MIFILHSENVGVLIYAKRTNQNLVSIVGNTSGMLFSVSER